MSLEKALQICRIAEAVKVQVAELNTAKGVVHAVDMIECGQKKWNFPLLRSSLGEGELTGRHMEGNMDPDTVLHLENCFTCNKRNHFARYCISLKGKFQVHIVKRYQENFI